MSDEDFLELCESGDARKVEDAIKLGANVNAKDNNSLPILGWTAFNVSSKMGPHRNRKSLTLIRSKIVYSYATHIFSQEVTQWTTQL